MGAPQKKEKMEKEEDRTPRQRRSKRAGRGCGGERKSGRLIQWAYVLTQGCEEEEEGSGGRGGRMDGHSPSPLPPKNLSRIEKLGSESQWRILGGGRVGRVCCVVPFFLWGKAAAGRQGGFVLSEGERKERKK